MQLDNARARLATASLDVLFETLGCTGDIGPACQLDDCPHRTLSRRRHADPVPMAARRLAGARRRPVRTGATAPAQGQLEAVRDRAGVGRALAASSWNYRSAPHSSVGGQTPLDIMRCHVLGDADAGNAPVRLLPRQQPLIRQHLALLHDPMLCRAHGDVAATLFREQQRDESLQMGPYHRTVANSTEPQRQRLAVVVVDLVESVRLMRQAESEVISRWREFVSRVQIEVVSAHNGRLIKSLGDGLMLVFGQARAAVAASFAMQRLIAFAQVNAGGSVSLKLRIGVHMTDLLVDELDVYGSGVNLAARLLSVARPGDVIVTSEIREELTDGLDGYIVDLGECYFKHWDDPVRAYRIAASDAGSGERVAPVVFSDQRPSVAVVPFTALAGNSAWGDALADVVVTALSCGGAVRVVSLLSTQAFRHAVPEPGRVRKMLGVAYLVTGSVASQGDRLLVDIKMCSTLDCEIRFAVRKVIDGRGLFSGDDQAMLDITTQMCAEIIRAEIHRARTLPLANLESYTLYLSGVHLMHRLSRFDFDRARVLLEHLSERHPRSAAPHAMLAKWHTLRAVQGWAENRMHAGRLAQASARRAVDIDPEHALALSMEAILAAQFDGDLIGARELGEAAVKADPQESHAWLNLGGIHSYLGNASEAVSMPRQAIELSPMDPARFAFDAFLAEGLLTAQRFGDAAEAARASIRLNAVHATSHRILTIALALEGRVLEAQRAAGDLLRLEPEFRVDAYQRRYAGRELQGFQIWLDALRTAGIQ